MNPSRRSQIIHRPRVDVVAPQPSLRRLAAEQTIRLAMFAGPLALGVWLGNASLANRQEAQQEIEYQRETWAVLEAEFRIEATSYLAELRSPIEPSPRFPRDDDGDGWILPRTGQQEQLQRIVQRINLYGSMVRSEQFVEYCDSLAAYIDYADQRRVVLQDIALHMEGIESSLKAIESMDGDEDYVAERRWENQNNRRELERQYAEAYSTLSDALDQLSLMIFDPSFLPEPPEVPDPNAR